MPTVNLDPEAVAYWYFRLNGFFQMQSFIVHPDNKGSQRTDADILGVRFPHRAERLFDNPNDLMEDDSKALNLSSELLDFVVAEVKTNQPCSLNGPWSNAEAQNVQRVLAAMGCLPHDHLEEAAAAIYGSGHFECKDSGVRVRLVALGREVSEELSVSHRDVVQITWSEVLSFIGNRLFKYRNQKKDSKQWDAQIQLIQFIMDDCSSHGELDEARFITETAQQMGLEFPR